MIAAELVVDLKADLLEGPLWDAATGRLLAVDILAGRVLAMDTATGGVDEWTLDEPVGARAEPVHHDDAARSR